jgi:homogentisate 1,2-dioxygenase
MVLLVAVSLLLYDDSILIADKNNYTDIQEIFGAHYTLPELGPLGGHGLANPRDFESPVASFDLDQTPWSSTSTFHSTVL